MKEKNSEPFLYQEDEIEFGSLILTLLASKRLIIGLTLVFTALVAIYNYTITPTYKATTTVILGNYAVPQLSCRDELWFKSACIRTNQAKKLLYTPEELIIELNMDVLQKIKNSVSISRKSNFSITINSLATSNEIAKNSISEIISYIQKRHQEEFENIKNLRAAKIKSFNENIKTIEKFEITPLNKKSTHELQIILKEIDFIKTNKLPLVNEEIDSLENERLTALKMQLIELNKIIDKTINSQIQYIIENKLPEIIEKINLYTQNLAENEKLLTQILDNQQTLENSSTVLAALRLTEIQDLKKNIFETKEKILNLRSIKSEQEVELNELEETKQLLEAYKKIGLLENTPTFPSTRKVSIPYFENILFEFKGNLINIEEKIFSIISSKLPELKDKKLSLILRLEELENKKYFFENSTLPEYELLKDTSNTKISNIELQKNEYESLLNNNNYTNASQLGEIITKDSPIEPHIVRNVIIAFLVSFFLSIFLVIVINLSKTPNNKQTT